MAADDFIQAGASAIPIPGISEAAGILGSIIGAHHAAAVKAEANNLNQAVPTYRSNLQAIVTAFNSGMVDGPTALQAVDEAVTEYYSAVSGIINRHSQDCSNLQSNCNGPCTVGCDWIQPWAQKVKAAIQQGAATVSFQGIPSHAGFSGLPSWSVTVQAPTVSQFVAKNSVTVGSKPSALTQASLQPISKGLSSNNLLVIVGILFLMFVGMFAIFYEA